LFSAPITLIIIYTLLRSKITYDPESLNKETIKLALQAFFFSLIFQKLYNWFSVLVMEPDQMIAIASLTPIVYVYVVLIVPIVEETVFRQIIYGWLQGNKEKFSIFAATISSAMFAAMHMNSTLFLGYFAVGFVLCYYYFKHKNLKIVIISHMFLNFHALFSQSIHMTFGG
jgi:membrane protease YdiL (CAAX protease family)